MPRTIAELYANAHGMTAEQAQADIRRNNATLLNVVDDFTPVSPTEDISDMLNEAAETLASYRRNPPTVFTSTPQGRDPLYSRFIQDQADTVSMVVVGNQPLTRQHLVDAEAVLSATRWVHISEYETKPQDQIEGTNMEYRFRITQTILLQDFINRYRSSTFSAEVLTEIYNKSYIYVNDSPVLQAHRTHLSDYDLHIYKEHLEFVETSKPENSEWTSMRRKNLRLDSNHLLDQIRTRYAFLNRPTNGLSNIVIDNYAPRLMHMSGLDSSRLHNIGNLPKTAYAISPWFASYFGVQQIATEQLCRILGFTLKDIKTLITKVKRKNYSISFVGYGGTGVNTIHWLTEMLKMTQMTNLFKFIEIHEPDTIEVSNLLRFPKDPYVESSSSYGSYSSKIRLLRNVEIRLLSKNQPNISTSKISGRDLPYSCNGLFYNYAERRSYPKDNHIFYGAPNLETRASFEDMGHFISATHNGNQAHLWLNPTQDTDLQVESYGLIELTPFFMNQLRLAIGLLEYLSQDDINLKQPDTLLGEYEFDGIPKLTPNRVYNFQLNQSTGLVATPEQAQTW